MDGGTYPNGLDRKTKDYSKYSEWLADLIRDVRKDLSAPMMPFVIVVLGVDGVSAKEGTIAFREAMSASTSMPEFKGNVTAVPTAPFLIGNCLGERALGAGVRIM